MTHSLAQCSHPEIAALMPATASRPARRLALAAPVVALILAFTAIPTELRPPGEGVTELVKLQWGWLDVITNVLAYVPLGMAAALRSRWRTIGLATSVSMFAEATQVATTARSPSFVDVAANVLGAAIGVALCRRSHGACHHVVLRKRVAVLAFVLVAMIYLPLAAHVTPVTVEHEIEMWRAAPPWRAVNDRGVTAPGKLEAYWTFDGDTPGRDASGNGLDGMLVHGPARVRGAVNSAVALNGQDQWVDVGDPVALRLVGSMTISAWINSTAFPRDDAAIVSDHSGYGYQLDTTIDQGPRTIAFKLANSTGMLMARYGRTPLETNRWYDVAGVYDAKAQSLDVYLDGRLDNGCLMGPVTSRQHVSGQKVFIGRRAGSRGFEFAGLIDDVRIFSRALSGREIAEQASQVMPGSATAASLGDIDTHDAPAGRNDACPPNDSTDARVVGLVVAVGMLFAVVSLSVWPARGFAVPTVPTLVLTLIAGAALMPALVGVIPAYFEFAVPLLTLAGGTVVVASVRDATER
jgi:VanZ family protein